MLTACFWCLRLLALAAVCLSAYLAYAGATATPVAGCGWGAFDCDAVLSSHWAKWFGVPVAVGGVVTYAIAFAGAFLAGAGSGGARASGWRLLELATPLAAGAAGWFLVVQLLALESFCLYCLVTHVCGVGIAVLTAVARLTDAGDTRRFPVAGTVGLGLTVTGEPLAMNSAEPPALGAATLVGAVGVVALVAGQLLGPDASPAPTVVEATALTEVLTVDDPATETGESAPSDGPIETTSLRPIEPAPPSTLAAAPRRQNGERRVTLLDGRLTIDTYAHPVIGSPDADHVLVELMDYSCPHCREFNEVVREALPRFEGRVAIVVMPVPGELLCNPYIKRSKPRSRGACNIAKVSLASAKVSPESFSELHDWLLEGERMPQYATAITRAQRHGDAYELSLAVRDASGEIGTRIDRYVKLMASLSRSGRIGLPTQIFPKRLVSGPPTTVDELCEQWAAEFEIDKPDSDLPF